MENLEVTTEQKFKNHNDLPSAPASSHLLLETGRAEGPRPSPDARRGSLVETDASTRTARGDVFTKRPRVARLARIKRIMKSDEDVRRARRRTRDTPPYQTPQA